MNKKLNYWDLWGSGVFGGFEVFRDFPISSTSLSSLLHHSNNFHTIDLFYKRFLSISLVITFRHAVAFSDGTIIDNPRFIKQSQSKVNRLAKHSRRGIEPLDRDIAAAQVMLNFARGKELASIVAESPSSISCGSLRQLGAKKRQKLVPSD